MAFLGSSRLQRRPSALGKVHLAIRQFTADGDAGVRWRQCTRQCGPADFIVRSCTAESCLSRIRSGR
jgi:hypothetical protein